MQAPGRTRQPLPTKGGASRNPLPRLQAQRNGLSDGRPRRRAREGDRTDGRTAPPGRRDVSDDGCRCIDRHGGVRHGCRRRRPPGRRAAVTSWNACRPPGRFRGRDSVRHRRCQAVGKLSWTGDTGFRIASRRHDSPVLASLCPRSSCGAIADRQADLSMNRCTALRPKDIGTDGTPPATDLACPISDDLGSGVLRQVTGVRIASGFMGQPQAGPGRRPQDQAEIVTVRTPRSRSATAGTLISHPEP